MSDQIRNAAGYYEIRAANRNGNIGGVATIYAGTTRARKLKVRAESYWMVADHDAGAHINPDGSGGGAHGPMGGFRFPNLPPWALIGHWEMFNQHPGTDDFGKTTPLGHAFLIGYGGTFDVPAQLASDLLHVQLRYYCNDEDYSDNAGWLHVYEEYSL